MFADYLKLIRFPLIFTALADPIAGYCLGMATGADITYLRPQALLPILLASGALYAAGMIFNDCADMVRDRTLHPDRPLASGRIAFAPAFALAIVLGLVAILAAQMVNARTGATAFALALGILLYNGVTKRNWVLGALTMGALRAGNVFLGFLAAAPPSLLLEGSPYLGVIFLYVTFLTLLSGLEEPPPRPKTFLALVILMALAAVGAVLVLPATFAEGGWLALALGFFLALALLARGLNALREFDPGQVATLVKIGVIGIIPLDAAVAAGMGNLSTATAILVVLLIPPVAFVTGFLRLPGMDRAN
jgi:4-hydroxybenzoate polyprenyltransferase